MMSYNWQINHLNAAYQPRTFGYNLSEKRIQMKKQFFTEQRLYHNTYPCFDNYGKNFKLKATLDLFQKPLTFWESFTYFDEIKYTSQIRPLSDGRLLALEMYYPYNDDQDKAEADHFSQTKHQSLYIDVSPFPLITSVQFQGIYNSIGFIGSFLTAITLVLSIFVNTNYTTASFQKLLWSQEE